MTVLQLAPQRADALAQARRALRRAETTVGVASLGERVPDGPAQFARRRPLAPVPDDAPTTRSNVPEQDVPRRTEALATGGGPRPAGLVSLPELGRAVAARAGTGSTVSVLGSTGAAFHVAAALWGPEAWGAVAALPDAGRLAAAQAGVPLARAHVIPNLGEEPLRVLSQLIDAYGVVLLGPVEGIGAAQRRRVEARVRQRHMSLVVAGPWPGALTEVRVLTQVRGGIGHGGGVLAPPLVRAELRSKTGQLWQERRAA
ncbi:MAG: hypothetical protein LBM66_02220 [Bifidobacteriaceae bacterium]|jgi:hypothetical protein|nr:hypothetical protein [Bifidobacteriaceae bacterium]